MAHRYADLTTDISVGFNSWMSVVFEGQDELDEVSAVPLAAKFLRDALNERVM